ncbi:MULTISPECIES: hypothetical protein [Bacillaceae]|uniref:Uncharacterized protein n=1 Tax=Evansella alkalicola TaxID=745819 RepID=A0ABS6JSV5_9BACI|nr:MULTISPECIES: hypothetical protein [Bacillaceae]MBU9721639.1 hypothetical protein [Bacillus alkalicola]
MSKKTKTIFRISIVLNILFVGIVAGGFFKMNHVTERVLIYNVAGNLLTLYVLITEQTENNWTNPGLVTMKMEDLAMGVSLSGNVGAESKILSKEELNTLMDLQVYLGGRFNLFVKDLPERYSDISEKEKEEYEKIAKILSDIFEDDTNEDISTDSVMKLVEDLVENLD